MDDTGSITMMEIRSKARRLKQRHPNLGLIIVDYLPLMTSGTSAENRVQEVSQISRSLKVLARDLQLDPRALAAVARRRAAPRQAPDPVRPARERIARAQDSDIVIFIYRDEYYNDESDQQGLAEVRRRQAPQRADRHDQALVLAPLREVLRPGGRLSDGRLVSGTPVRRSVPSRDRPPGGA